ncbi:hypothetical protein DCAR_0933244 [Daucus carota subsp. sativus]|uniref:Chromo domain-containing protein n=1 Tax=Daucus carota subsp. sativus TaxID=79200 RepID=A0AAF1BD94_DAUCS|nr:hypothetical protein DCAR_0933244 [Daucus carota subsp. sativus]
MQHIHNVFHVSMLKRYLPDSNHVIEYEPIEIQPDLSFVERPVQILDRREKVLRNKSVSLVRVLWRNPRVEESTWELEKKASDSQPTKHWCGWMRQSGCRAGGATVPRRCGDAGCRWRRRRVYRRRKEEQGGVSIAVNYPIQIYSKQYRVEFITSQYVALFGTSFEACFYEAWLGIITRTDQL